MNRNNFNPEDLYNQTPIFQGGMPGYEDDEYTSNIRRTNNFSVNKHHIPQYQTQTMPQMSLSSLEQDINLILDPSLGSNKIVNYPDNHPQEVTGIIDKQFNTDSLVSNNITEKKINESLKDHYVVIDSSDRDVTRYPNPFSYKVYFNSFATSDASITKSFDRVKSVNLESSILPNKYYFLKQDISLNAGDDLIVSRITDVSRNEMINLTSEDVSGSFAIIDVTDSLSGSIFTRRVKFAEETTYPLTIDKVYEYVFTFNDNGSGELPSNVHESSPSYPTFIQQYLMQSFALMNNKYSLLYVDELEYANEYSTNDALSKSFSVMFPDCLNTNVFYTKSKFKDKVFKFDNLGSINKMTISIRDHNGTQLKNSSENYVDTDVPLDKLCTCGTDNDGYFVRNYRCACSYFRHPLYHHFQNTLIFNIKSFEIGMDKEIF